MKRKRPSKHYRIINTKRGKKRVLVNPKIKKKVINKTKKKGTINKSNRKIFQHLSSSKIYNTEFGGAIDFDLTGKVENINVIPGSELEVDLPPDYEVQYHTHPDKDMSPPTPEDVIALLGNKNQQAEIVFREGKSFTIIKTPKTKALSRLPTARLYQKLDRAFLKSRGRNWENKYKKELENMGFIVDINNKPGSLLDVNVHIIEPKKRKRR